jgi:hypothetical protein
VRVLLIAAATALLLLLLWIATGALIDNILGPKEAARTYTLDTIPVYSPEQLFYAGDCVRLVLTADGNKITFERIQCPEEEK